MSNSAGDVVDGARPAAAASTRGVTARRIGLPLLTTLAVGLLLSTAPHLVAKAQTGSYHWVADTDELSIYLAVAAKLYHGDGLRLSDPVSPRNVPTVFPWSQIAPSTLAARALGTGPLSVSLIWRIFAGVTVSLCWFLLFYYWTRTGWLACAAALLLMADGDLLTGRLFLRQVAVTGDLLAGGAQQLLATKPNLMPQWRIMTPGLSLGFLLVYTWALLRAIDLRTRMALALAGAAFGILFYVYVYYWTAAGLSLLACAALFPRDRSVFVTTGVVGGLLGAPAVIRDSLFRAEWNADWLARTDKFVEIGHFQELIVPKLGPMLALVATGYAIARQPRLRFLGVHVAAGLLLLNHQLLTGLQVENFHYAYFWGPLCSALLVLVGLDLYRSAGRRLGHRWAMVALVGLLGVELTTGLYLRMRESVDSRNAVRLNQQLAAFKQNQVDHPVSKTPNAVMAGRRSYLRLAAVLDNQRALIGRPVDFSAVIDDEQWSERLALNAVLSGDDARAFQADQRQVLDANLWGPWARDERLQRELLDDRLAKFRWASTSVAAAVARYDVTYLVLPRGTTPHSYVTRNWNEIPSGEWSVWANPHLPH